MSIIKTSGSKLIATRLRQLSTTFWKDRATLYAEENIRFKPNWGTVTMVQQANHNFTINDIAKELGFAHTSVLKIVKDMTQEGYLTSIVDTRDSRRKIITLTPQGNEEHRKNTKLQIGIEAVNAQLTEDTKLLEALDIIESRLSESSYNDRLRSELKKTETMKNIKIDTDPSKLDLELIYDYLKSSYWAKGRTKSEIETSINNSLCFGVYENEEFIGLARVVTDTVVFAYLMDVFILKQHQGKGIGKLLMNTVFTYPSLIDVNKWYLVTLDAQELYQKFGFKNFDMPGRNVMTVSKSDLIIN